jgi:hypothetical protein
LGLALVSAATQSGAWCAAVGLPSLGLLAADQLGVDLAHLALVPAPGEQWPTVTAALLEGMELVLLRPPGRVRIADARRLAARARERGAVMLVMEQPGRTWPEGTDVRLSVAATWWEGLRAGHGHLQARRVDVVAGGRRAAARERRVSLWLPDPLGKVAPAAPVAPVVASGLAAG